MCRYVSTVPCSARGIMQTGALRTRYLNGPDTVSKTLQHLSDKCVTDVESRITIQ